MSDEEYDLYYHDELFVEYNSHPTPKQVHNMAYSNNFINLRLNTRSIS